MRPYRTNLRDVPHVEGLSPKEGWINMQVQFLVDKKTANSDKLVLGYTVLPPGARHDAHRHFHADEFLLVMKGSGEIYTDHGTEPAKEGDVVFTERGHWHGFNNTTDEDVILVWGWSGAGSLDSAGYEVSYDEKLYRSNQREGPLPSANCPEARSAEGKSHEREGPLPSANYPEARSAEGKSHEREG